MTLNFGPQVAVVDWQFLEFRVASPGIPGDSTPFNNEPSDDDLFSAIDMDWDVDPDWGEDDGGDDGEDPD